MCYTEEVMTMNKKEVFLFLGVKTIANFLFLGGLSFLLYSLFPIALSSAQTILNKNKNLNKPQIQATFADTLDLYHKPTFGDILKISPPLGVIPISTEAAIIITKINVNSPIIWEVSATDQKVYLEALNHGVAQAKDTALPDQNGNVYLFDHSTFNPWEITKYGAVFTELNKLIKDDRITIFYQGKRYDYLVQQKEVVNSSNVEPLTKKTTEAILTLQTCSPPGVDKDRLIITAKRVAIY